MTLKNSCFLQCRHSAKSMHIIIINICIPPKGPSINGATLIFYILPPPISPLFTKQLCHDNQSILYFIYHPPSPYGLTLFMDVPSHEVQIIQQSFFIILTSFNLISVLGNLWHFNFNYCTKLITIQSYLETNKCTVPISCECASFYTFRHPINAAGHL